MHATRFCSFCVFFCTNIYVGYVSLLHKELLCDSVWTGRSTRFLADEEWSVSSFRYIASLGLNSVLSAQMSSNLPLGQHVLAIMIDFGSLLKLYVLLLMLDVLLLMLCKT